MAETNAIFLDYLTAATRIVRFAVGYARDEILPVVATERQAYHADGLDPWVASALSLTDAAGDNVKAYIEALRRRLDSEIQAAADKVRVAASAEGSRNTKKWVASVAAGANIDVGMLVRDDDLVDLLSLKVEETVGLIKNLSSDMAARIERLALGSILEGRGNYETAKLLTEIDGIGRRRAKLIARDQASKLNGEMNEFRQRQAGISHFVWKTVIDGRERASHHDRNGKTYSWDDLPGGEKPGGPINCRCRASALVVDDEDSAREVAETPDLDAEELFATNEPLIRKVGGTINEPVLEWQRDALLVRQVELKEVESLVVALRANREVLEADAERLYLAIYGGEADEIAVASGVFSSRRAELFKAVTERLRVISELVEHAILYGISR